MRQGNERAGRPGFLGDHPGGLTGSGGGAGVRRGVKQCIAGLLPRRRRLLLRQQWSVSRVGRVRDGGGGGGSGVEPERAIFNPRNQSCRRAHEHTQTHTQTHTGSYISQNRACRYIGFDESCLERVYWLRVRTLVVSGGC